MTSGSFYSVVNNPWCRQKSSSSIYVLASLFKSWPEDLVNVMAGADSSSINVMGGRAFLNKWYNSVSRNALSFHLCNWAIFSDYMHAAVFG